MCEIKPRSKRCHVDTATHEQWKAGGEGREWLELALAKSLERVGAHGKKQHKKLRVACQGSCDDPMQFFQNVGATKQALSAL